MGYLGFEAQQRQGIVCSPKCPDLLWGPPGLLLNGYWGLFPKG